MQRILMSFLAFAFLVASSATSMAVHAMPHVAPTSAAVTHGDCGGDTGGAAAVDTAACFEVCVVACGAFWERSEPALAVHPPLALTPPAEPASSGLTTAAEPRPPRA